VTTVFLNLLSATTVALALLADATSFGAQTTTLALVLLPIALLLGIVTRRAAHRGQQCGDCCERRAAVVTTAVA
jgi:hypothetical protein